MSDIYTNVYQRGNHLYVRGIENGRKFNRKVEFQPTVWMKGKLNGTTDQWKTLEGETVYAFQPGGIYDCKEFAKRYEGVEGFEIYQSPGHTYQYIAETYPGEIKFDPQDISVFTIDIETQTEYGFPEPSLANEVIQLITVKDTKHNKIVTWGLHPFVNNMEHVEYRYLSTEQALLKDFIVWWQQNYPDAVTGWNSSLFDITYLYNRMCKVVGETLANKLSPWGQVRQREVNFGSRSVLKTYISGIASLDYLDLYKKFTYIVRESYRLDYIAQVELGERKLENPGTSFKDFYTNFWDTFVLYNIKDVELVDRLDDKMKLMDLALTVAYAAKVNYEDVFSSVRLWDIIIYNYLNDQKTVIPLKKSHNKTGHFEGAYVKEPLAGKHNWGCSFDLNSLYPHIIMQYNMSPETISGVRLDTSVDKLLNKSIDLSSVYEQNLAMAANGWCFYKDVRGLLPSLMQLYYDKRVIYKKEMLKAKQEAEAIKAEKERRGL